MFKSTVSVLVAALVLSPVALAEGGKKVTLTHEYDAALLSTDEGANLVLGELDRAAKRICTSRIPAFGGYFTDEACAQSLVVGAVKQISADQTKAGVSIAPRFEQIALTQLASAE